MMKAFDTSDVDAAAAEAEWTQRQLRRALEQRQRRFLQGWSAAIEHVGADVTITDGIPIEVPA